MPQRGSKHTGSTESHPPKEVNSKVRVSSGRGGSGNIVCPTELAAANLKHEAELIRCRGRMEKKQEELVKYNKKQYTGRGGTGNIKAASVAQWVSFDKSADPDDSYEDIVVERNKQTPKPLRTGRGGPGNGFSKTPLNPDRPSSSFSRLSLSSSNSSSGSSSRLSQFSSSSSSYASSFGQHSHRHHSKRSESPSLLSRFSKYKQHEISCDLISLENIDETKFRRGSWWKRTDTPIPSLTPQIVVSNCDFLDETTAAVLEVMERFEGDQDVGLEVPELGRNGNQRTLWTLPEDSDLNEKESDGGPAELDDREDSEWERDVLMQAQHEISSL